MAADQSPPPWAFVRELCARPFQPRRLGSTLAVHAFYPRKPSDADDADDVQVADPHLPSTESAPANETGDTGGNNNGVGNARVKLATAEPGHQTPSSAAWMFGQLHGSLKQLHHPNLCQYIDLVRGHHDRCLVVTEYFSDMSLADFDGDVRPHLRKWCRQTFDALAYLNSVGIAHRHLHPSNIRLDAQMDVKLADYALYALTDSGTRVAFPIDYPEYIAPEFVASLPSGNMWAADVWAFGIILVEIVARRKSFWQSSQIADIFSEMVTLCSSVGALDQYLETVLPPDLPLQLVDFIRCCLATDPTKRPRPIDLLSHKYLEEETAQDETLLTTSDQVQYPSIDEPLENIPVQHVFCLWKTAGGDVERTFARCSQVSNTPPIERLPLIFCADGTEIGGSLDDTSLYSDEFIILPTDHLAAKLKDSLVMSSDAADLNTSEAAAISPTVASGLTFNQVNFDVPTSPVDDSTSRMSWSQNGTANLNNSSNGLQKTMPPPFLTRYYNTLASYVRLPLSIRESDAVYQYMRLRIFTYLLRTYPASRKEIRRQAAIDIPPILRGAVWACLLGLAEDYERTYRRLDFDRPHEIDRQIDVDIPRCHQYNAFMNCPQGQDKLRMLLKAWIAGNSNLVYWQGLDSLCAPFLLANFSDEALAYWSLQQLVPRYLKLFFVNDNSAVIQDYLAVFRQLISFHDPELGSHMNRIGFSPDLYAIPWFLTLFTHIFPLHKIVHLWDRLFVLSTNLSTFPVFLGLTILHNLRAKLLKSDFSDCITHFSDMPDYDLAECVGHAVMFWRKTPASMVERVGLGAVDEQTEKRTALEVQNGTVESPLPPHMSSTTDESPMSPYEICQKWWDRPVPLEIKKVESVPRISLSDLLRMGNKAGVMDIRSTAQFNAGHYPLSVNISPAALDTEHIGQLRDRYQYLVVIAERGDSGSKFAETLVDMFIPHVAVLNGGMDVVSTTTSFACSCSSGAGVDVAGRCSMSLLDSPVQMMDTSMAD